MLRNYDATLHKIGNYYDITIKNGLQNAKVYCTSRPYSNEKTLLGTIEGNEIVVEVTENKRYYFVITSDNHPDIIIGDRLVDIAEIPNFRDQGGYLTKSGKTVKWGRFFRGGALADLSEDVKHYLDAMGIKFVLDYRDMFEAQKRPDYVPVGARHAVIPAIRKMSLGDINNAEVRDLDKLLETISDQEEADAVFKGFCSIYLHLPFENPAYTAMFNALDEDNQPIYQHCTMGKDRTGVGCAMLLMALGVDRETAIGDYCLSTVYRAEENKKIFAEYAKNNSNVYAQAVFQETMKVRAEFLRTSLQEIDKKYPDFETFLRQEYEITDERIAHWREIHLV